MYDLSEWTSQRIMNGSVFHEKKPIAAASFSSLREGAMMSRSHFASKDYTTLPEFSSTDMGYCHTPPRSNFYPAQQPYSQPINAYAYHNASRIGSAGSYTAAAKVDYSYAHLYKQFDNFSPETHSPSQDIVKKEPAEPEAQMVNGKPRKLRKPRTIYSNYQLAALQQRFHGTQYLALPERAALAATLGLTQTQVKIWFQNRRSKFKKIYKNGEFPSLLDVSLPLSPAVPSDPLVSSSPPSPTVWENNNNNNNNRIKDNIDAPLDAAAREQSPLVVSSPALFRAGDYAHHNWYQQQGSHLGLPQQGTLQSHYIPPHTQSLAY